MTGTNVVATMRVMGEGSLEALRQSNRARIVAALGERGEASRVELVAATGLARTTVSSLIGDLLHEGVVVERGAARSGPSGGRPAVVLSLDPTSGAFAGIDLGHDGVRVVVVDRAGRRLGGRHEALDVDADEPSTLTVIARLLRDVRREHDVVRLIGAGAAVSAPLDPGGRLASRAILTDWEADVGAALRTRLRTPVTVGNDANLGALAEVTFGAAAGERDVLYVMLSAGIGVGMILHGRLYEGHRGVAGELGHVLVAPGGAACRCGAHGCLETVAGTGALLAATGAPALGALLERLAAGERSAGAAVRAAAVSVGAAVAALCRVLDPAMVVVGGDLAAAGDALLSPVRAAFGDWDRAPKVVRGTLGPEAEALGAAAAAMRTAATITMEPQ